MTARLYRTDEGWVYVSPALTPEVADDMSRRLGAWRPGQPLVLPEAAEYVDMRDIDYADEPEAPLTVTRDPLEDLRLLFAFVAGAAIAWISFLIGGLG